jgi:hypothetical protein
MNNQQIDILDYEAGDETNLQDPTDPHEKVERAWLDKIAKLLTHIEEVLDVGNTELRITDVNKFILARADVLDSFDSPEISGWLDYMRKMNRCPYRKFPIRG